MYNISIIIFQQLKNRISSFFKRLNYKIDYFYDFSVVKIHKIAIIFFKTVGKFNMKYQTSNIDII